MEARITAQSQSFKLRERLEEAKVSHGQEVRADLPNVRVAVLAAGAAGHEQQNRRARADRGIGAERAAQIEGGRCARRRVEHDDIGARRARPLEHRGFGEHAQHGVAASPERSDDVREGVVLIAGDEDPRRSGEARSNRHTESDVQRPT